MLRYTLSSSAALRAMGVNRAEPRATAFEQLLPDVDQSIQYCAEPNAGKRPDRAVRVCADRAYGSGGGNVAELENGTEHAVWFRWHWLQCLASAVAGYLLADLLWKMAEARSLGLDLDHAALILFLTLIGWRQPTHRPPWAKIAAVVLIGVIVVSQRSGSL
jgi:hypothetical protein